MLKSVAVQMRQQVVEAPETFSVDVLKLGDHNLITVIILLTSGARDMSTRKNVQKRSPRAFSVASYGSCTSAKDTPTSQSYVAE